MTPDGCDSERFRCGRRANALQVSVKHGGYKPPEDIRYNERSTAKRVNGRTKDEYDARMV